MTISEGNNAPLQGRVPTNLISILSAEVCLDSRDGLR